MTVKWTVYRAKTNQKISTWFNMDAIWCHSSLVRTWWRMLRYASIHQTPITYNNKCLQNTLGSCWIFGLAGQSSARSPIKCAGESMPGGTLKISKMSGMGKQPTAHHQTVSWRVISKTLRKKKETRQGNWTCHIVRMEVLIRTQSMNGCSIAMFI